MKAKTATENGFKETEIGLIPSDWDIDKLGKYCEVFSGYAFKSSDFAEKGVLIVKIGNLQDGTIVVDNRTNYYPKAIDESLEKFVLKREDVLIALTGATTGKVAVVPEKFEGSLLNQRVGKFNIFDKKLDNSFFRFFSITSKFQDDIKGNILKSAQGNVSPKKIEQLTIILPAFSEQQKIALVLSKTQQAIEQQDKIIQITKELKKSLMNKLFTEGLHAEEQKETEIGMMPKSWEVGELKNIVRHKIVDGVHKTPKYVQEGIPFVTAKDIVDNKVSLVNCKYITEVEHLVLTKRAKPEKEDILLTKVGTVGNVALVRDNLDFSIFVQVALIKPDLKIIFPEYLFFCLQSDGSQKEIINNTAQSTMKFIGTQNIGRVKVPLPSIREQQKITNILSNIDKKLSQAESRKQTLQSLFKAMLNQLMTGRVRVENLDIEVN